MWWTREETMPNRPNRPWIIVLRCVGRLQGLCSRKALICLLSVPLALLLVAYIQTSTREAFHPPAFQSIPLSIRSSLSNFKGPNTDAQKALRKNAPSEKKPNETSDTNRARNAKTLNGTVDESHKTDRTNPSSVAQLRDQNARKNTANSDPNQHDQSLDVHLHDSELGHTGETTANHRHAFNTQIQEGTIAIGGGITSAKIPPQATATEMLQRMPLFNAALPSFCESCGTKFTYHFYLAYDYNDGLFSNQAQLEVFSRLFYEQVRAKCPTNARVQLHMVQCDHTKKPAWAQNDAMMEAYIDNMEYFYRINDDSQLGNQPWPELFTDRLRKFTPPNLGVVGPNHSGGNMAILTYDFTHHTHQDMFGFHYPRDFTDWYGDDWITGVYKPGRVEKMKQVSLKHTMQLGQRYSHHLDGKKLPPRFTIDKAIVQRYVQYLSSGASAVSRDPSLVIALSLCDRQPARTIGALRNVQQARVHFPGWTVRVYVPQGEGVVPGRILNKMATLGAEIYEVAASGAEVSKSEDYVQVQGKEGVLLESCSLAWDIVRDESVHTVLFRDPEFRLSDRQKAAVDEWMNMGGQPDAKDKTAGKLDTGDKVNKTSEAGPATDNKDNKSNGQTTTASKRALMHCLRDHASHATLPIVPGLLGIDLHALRANSSLYAKLTAILDSETLNPNIPLKLNNPHSPSESKSKSDKPPPPPPTPKSNPTSLEKRLWDAFEHEFLCHDSVSCDAWTNSRAFPVPPLVSNPTHEGQRFDEHMVSQSPYKYNPADHKCKK